jgi:hypothetical protein
LDVRYVISLVIGASLLVVACKKDCDCDNPTATSATTMTVSSTPNPTPEPAATPSPTPESTIMFTECRARPSAIQAGDSFRIDYSVTQGLVRLARDGDQAFAMGLPGTGSYTVNSGEPGYPARTGVNKYWCISATNRLVREKTSIDVKP